MKNQGGMKNNPATQGNSTADRAFTNQREAQKQNGISNGGSQQSFQTSNRDTNRKNDKSK